MLVPVRVDGAATEWSVVELQGDLIADDLSAASNTLISTGEALEDIHTDALAGVDIGTLRFVDGVPTLRVGNHVLAGKVAALPKALAVLEKAEMGDEHAGDARVCYEVVGIARSRVIFSSRPKPVLTE